MKPEENKPPGGAIKAQVKCCLEHIALSLCMGKYKCSPSWHDRHDVRPASRSKATASNVVIVLLRLLSECILSLMEQHVLCKASIDLAKEKQRTEIALLISGITAAAGSQPQQRRADDSRIGSLGCESRKCNRYRRSFYRRYRIGSGPGLA